MKESVINGEMPLTGACDINTDLVISKWNHLWCLVENNRPHLKEHYFRLVKYIRKDSLKTSLKITISIEQAKELIDKLKLNKILTGKRYVCSYRRQEDIDMLWEYHLDKSN